jgi:hypothetical protein
LLSGVLRHRAAKVVLICCDVCCFCMGVLHRSLHIQGAVALSLSRLAPLALSMMGPVVALQDSFYRLLVAGSLGGWCVHARFSAGSAVKGVWLHSNSPKST